MTLIVAVALAQWWLVHDLHTLPSPIFGGDYSYQMGCIESIRDLRDERESALRLERGLSSKQST